MTQCDHSGTMGLSQHYHMCDIIYVSCSCQQCCHFTVTSDILIETASAMTTIGIGPFFTYGTYKRGLIIRVLFFVFVSSMHRNAKGFQLNVGDNRYSQSQIWFELAELQIMIRR